MHDGIDELKFITLEEGGIEDMLGVYNQVLSELPGHRCLDAKGFSERYLKSSAPIGFSYKHSILTLFGPSAKTVGFSLVKVTPPARPRPVAAIRAFGVQKELRGRRIGERMLRTQVRRLFREGYVSIKMPGIRDSNKPALSLMKGLGAETLGGTTHWQKDLSKGTALRCRPPSDLGLSLAGVDRSEPIKLYGDFCRIFSETSMGMDLPSFQGMGWGNTASTLAIIDGEVVGMALVEDAEDPDYLSYVGVFKDLRNRGIGTLLVMKATQKMREAGTRFARTVTRDDNEAMTKIVTSQGFEPTGTTLHMVIRRAEWARRGWFQDEIG